MIDTATARDRCHQLLETARKAGADGADAVCRAESSEGVSVRLGTLEDVERSEGEEIGLRVFVGKRSASVHTSDFGSDAFRALAERAVAMARLAPEDPYAGLAARDQLAATAESHASLELNDCGSEPSPESLRTRALAVEDAARAIAGVTNSEGGGASFGRSVVALATSEGFAGSYEGTSHALSVSVISGEGAGMERDSASRVCRHEADLPDPEEIGRLAGERAVARLRPGKMPSRQMPVVFDRRVSSSLVGHLLGAMSAAAAARRATFLLDRIEEQIFPAAIRIEELPHKPRGLRSRPFDGEGVETRKRVLVEDGRLTGWLTNVAAANQLGLPLTGHAARGGSGAPGISPSNIEVLAGEASPEQLISEITDGVLVTHLMGQGVNEITGDYSRGANGFRIVNGQIAEPVSEFTIAGNLLDMFGAMTAADDLESWRAINVPSLRVDGMTIAGDAG